MSGFSADWLARREPHDARARNAAVLDAVVASVQGLGVVRIVDLACGTGAMLRTLAPRLSCPQHWRLADNDLGLLARAAASPAPRGVVVHAVPLDLNRDLEAALDGAVDIVVTSALLDLVSEPWLERLAVETAARALPLYAALSYDGRTELAPADPLDAPVLKAFNAHQRTDKGFGPALGPAAASAAMARFKSLGYEVAEGASDWVMGPEDADMQCDVLAGWAAAACDAGLSRAAAADWLGRRHDLVAAGRCTIRIGHVDFWARQIGAR
jgi:Methyltransferase domain